MNWTEVHDIEEHLTKGNSPNMSINHKEQGVDNGSMFGSDGYFKIRRNELRFIFRCLHHGPGNETLVMEWTNGTIVHDNESDLMFSSVIKEFQHGFTALQFSSQLINVNSALFMYNTTPA